jgi:iron complex transport system substrate-binding protein
MRIASLVCSNTEIVCALGRGGWLVGVDDHSDHPPGAVAGLPRLGPDLGIDVDRLAALAPDLVIASLTVPGHERVVAEIDAAGLPWIAPAPERLGDIERDILEIGSRLGAAARAEELVRGMRRELDGIRAARTRTPPVPLLVEWWPKPVIVPGRRSWVSDLLEVAGAANPFGDRDAKSLPVDAEDARAAGVRAIAISWCGVEERNYRLERVLGRPGWGEVPAVRDRIVAPISEAFLGRPGPRVVEGARRLAELVARVPADPDR